MPPSGFCDAVMRPNLIPDMISGGTLPLAILVASPNNSVHTTFPNKTLRCSVVMPDGPPATPLRALLKFLVKRSKSWPTAKFSAQMMTLPGATKKSWPSHIVS